MHSQSRELGITPFTIHRGVEQLAARRAHNPEVGGSSPPPATIEEIREGFLFFYGSGGRTCVLSYIYNPPKPSFDKEGLWQDFVLHSFAIWTTPSKSLEISIWSPTKKEKLNVSPSLFAYSTLSIPLIINAVTRRHLCLCVGGLFCAR